MTEPFLDGNCARSRQTAAGTVSARAGGAWMRPGLAGRAGAGPRALRLGLLCVRAGAGRARAYGAGPDPAYHAATAPSAGGRGRQTRSIHSVPEERCTSHSCCSRPCASCC